MRLPSECMSPRRERSGMVSHDLRLPVLQLDPAKVLHPCSMLRKKAGPVLPPRVNLDTVVPPGPSVDLAVATNKAHCAPALRDDPRITPVEVDAELEHRSGTLDDVTITEVEAKEIGIAGAVSLTVAAARAELRARGALGLCPPPAHRRQRNTGQPYDLAVIGPRANQPLDDLEVFRRPRHCGFRRSDERT